MSPRYSALCLVRGRERLLAHLASGGCLNIVFDSDWKPERINSLRPDIVISVGESHYEIWNCYKRAKALGIPTLTLQDGIPEWRDIWENPKYGLGDRQLNRQLFFADKVACHGALQQRLFSHWGMSSKIEVVGIPWFDHLLQLSRERPNPLHSRPRLVIMTANTPAFTSDQFALVASSLRDLREALRQRPEWEPVWRLRGEIRRVIDDAPSDDRPLQELLSTATAVVTTPSTVQIESMLAGCPTAVLDYTNSPQYLQAAWSITSAIHLLPVLDMLRKPAANRMLFQDMILHDYLACATPATARMIKLVQIMSEIGRSAREANRLPSFPADLLRHTPVEMGASSLWNLATLYPTHPVFSRTDTEYLQQELVNVRQENELLRGQLAQQRLGTWVAAGARYLVRQLKKRDLGRR